ncbi:39S ribosomal protein L20, mitochondrial [Anopheles arabiensis]|uniref:Large ribosomal subunit protein bL20m n=4 Tax=gambiae species complex TaxID=44542 RepID=A0A1S4GBI3_ANOGA|nr:large ribosomal subunit protein bL20m [Anopheles gambiae]XP_040151213.1 39S ribosomal protein L20, mitochondrial [Anopheles arabiensis]XP_040220626.1 39S ribosomal protein L20, mitochondrial [Anopheles coluzzii]XP_041762423.1 39S ribosomal protein L20, mitochondrial [Anopheles merus]
MVFTSVVNFVRSRGPDEFWRKRRIFKLAAHYIGRRRNCYSIAIRNVNRALAYATKGRELKKEDMRELWTQRVNAGCEQHGMQFADFQYGLYRNDILLNRKVLADLAIWEPRTFEALAKISQQVPEEGSGDK